ncbi:MAG: hypothetical protein ABFE01_02015, partial [Phycisphaerales bacterium]
GRMFHMNGTGPETTEHRWCFPDGGVFIAKWFTNEKGMPAFSLLPHNPHLPSDGRDDKLDDMVDADLATVAGELGIPASGSREMIIEAIRSKRAEGKPKKKGATYDPATRNN